MSGLRRIPDGTAGAALGADVVLAVVAPSFGVHSETFISGHARVSRPVAPS